MYKKLICYIPIFSMLLLLSACDIDLRVQTYMRDIVDVVEESEPLMTPATIAIETAGEDSFSKIEDFIDRTFRDASNFRTESKQMSTYLLADIDMPMVYNFDANWSQYRDDLAIITLKAIDNEKNAYAFGLSLNKDKLKDISIHIENNYMQSIGLENVELSVKVNNDMRNKIILQPQSVYADGNPVPFRSKCDLERRDSLHIKLSDVLRDSLDHHDNVYFMKIDLEK